MSQYNGAPNGMQNNTQNKKSSNKMMIMGVLFVYVCCMCIMGGVSLYYVYTHQETEELEDGETGEIDTTEGFMGRLRKEGFMGRLRKEGFAGRIKTLLK